MEPHPRLGSIDWASAGSVRADPGMNDGMAMLPAKENSNHPAITERRWNLATAGSMGMSLSAISGRTESFSRRVAQSAETKWPGGVRIPPGPVVSSLPAWVSGCRQKDWISWAPRWTLGRALVWRDPGNSVGDIPKGGNG